MPKAIHALLASAALFLSLTPAANADWLSDAWSDSGVAAHGNPSITVRPEGLFVTLPSATLEQAHAAGLTTSDALLAFLGRYSPQCSAVLDLNAPRKQLKVALSVQDETVLADVPDETQSEMLGALTEEMTRRSAESEKPARPVVPHVTRVFTVSTEQVEYSLDYAPQKKAHCVVVPDEIS